MRGSLMTESTRHSPECKAHEIISPRGCGSTSMVPFSLYGPMSPGSVYDRKDGGGGSTNEMYLYRRITC